MLYRRTAHQKWGKAGSLAWPYKRWDMSDGDRCINMTEGTLSITLETSGSNCEECLTWERVSFSQPKWYQCWFTTFPDSCDFLLLSLPTSLARLECTLKCGSVDQDKAAMHFFSFDCLSAKEREIIDLKRVKDLILDWQGFI